MTCCQFADEETLEHDPDLFNCETCAVRHAVSGLDAENIDAWNIFHRLASRFLVDVHLTAEMFKALTAGWPSERVIDLIERLQLAYDILLPPSTPTQ